MKHSIGNREVKIMRISSQSEDVISRSTSTPKTVQKEISVQETQEINVQKSQVQAKVKSAQDQEKSKGVISKEQLEVAVQTMNDFLEVQHKSSKFVFHEGLDKYYVKLIDSDTEEVIKEIPPERLLDAFYEMQKLTGMIVDERI